MAETKARSLHRREDLSTLLEDDRNRNVGDFNRALGAALQAVQDLALPSNASGQRL